MRHRIAGNRMSMPEPRRRAARRSLMHGLIRYERINTTEARANAIRGEVEKLINTAIKGRVAARKHLSTVISDDEKITQLLAFAHRGRFSLKAKVGSNEERAKENKAPLTETGRRFAEQKLKNRRDDLLKIVADENEAERALEAAYHAVVIEYNARRNLMSALDDELVVKKLLDEIAPRYVSRKGGFTRITKLGKRQGDAADMAQIALV